MKMIKNIYRNFSIVLVSLSLSLLILSCDSDSSSGPPENLEIYDTWTSTSYSYYTNADCSGEGISFDEYAELVIDDAVTAEAQTLMDSECLNPDTQTLVCDLEYWRDHVIDLWAASDDEEEQAVIDEIISTTGIPATSLGSIELLISVNMTFDVSYDGFCSDLSDIALNLPEEECNIGGSEWVDLECTFPTEDSCPSYIGTWNTGYQGGWEENGDNYLITWTTNAGGTTHTRTLLYSEELISMIEYGSDELCVGLDFTRK